MMTDDEEQISPLEHEPSIVKPDDEWYPSNLDWYVKWAASILVLVSLAFRAAGLQWRMYDLVIGAIGIALWLWVSIMWKDRALIMLNVVSLFMVSVAILGEI